MKKLTGNYNAISKIANSENRNKGNTDQITASVIANAAQFLGLNCPGDCRN